MSSCVGEQGPIKDSQQVSHLHHGELRGTAQYLRGTHIKDQSLRSGPKILLAGDIQFIEEGKWTRQKRYD